MKTGLGILMSLLCFIGHADAQHRGFGGFFRQSLPFASGIRTYGYPSFAFAGSYGVGYPNNFGYANSFGGAFGSAYPCYSPPISLLPPPVSQQSYAIPQVSVPIMPNANYSLETLPTQVPCPQQSLSLQGQNYAIGAYLGQGYSGGIGYSQGGYGFSPQVYLSQGYGLTRFRGIGPQFVNSFLSTNAVRSRIGGFGNAGFVGPAFRSVAGIVRSSIGVASRFGFAGRSAVIVTRRR